MDRKNLLQLTMKGTCISLRGTPMTEQLPAAQIRMIGATESALTVLDQPAQWKDGVYTGAPLIQQQLLQVVIQTEKPVVVSPALTDLVHADWEKGHLLTGFLPLQDRIGQVELTLEGDTTLRLLFEVFPSRVAWREDHDTMQTELNRLIRQLLADTIQKRDPDFSAASLSEEALVSEITQRCAAFLEAADELLPDIAHTAQTWLPRKDAAADTAENRLLKHLLRAAVRRLRSLPDFINLDEQIGALNRRATAEALSYVGLYCVGEDTKPGDMAPAYQGVYQCYLRLLYSVAFVESWTIFTPQKLPHLYRCWSYLKIAELLQTRYGLRAQTAVRLQKGRLVLPMLDAQPAFMEFAGPSDGRILLALLPAGEKWQQDLIQLYKDEQLLAVFTPCYRVGRDRMLLPEDLTAAYHTRNRLYFECRSSVPGAVVLFPAEDGDRYRDHPVYKSLRQEGVGGVPFLPGQDATLMRLLDKLLCGVPMLDYEEASLPEELELALEDVNWERRGVLIGALRNSGQLEVCLNHHFYHMPAHLVEQDAHPITHVALYQSRKLFGKESGIWYYGEVAEYNAVPRYTIPEIKSYSQDIYYRFEIRRWHTLPQPIRIQDSGSVVKMTNLFLLQNCRVDTGLLIASEEMFRLQYALQQALDTVAETSAETETGFRLYGFMVAVSRGRIQVFRDNGMVAELTVAEYQRRPAEALEALYQHMFGLPEEEETTQ